MHLVQVTKWGGTPEYITAAAPPEVPSDGKLLQIKLIATGLHRLVRLRVAGNHYSAHTLPHVLGVDGTGTVLTASSPLRGRTVYFSTLGSGGGSFAEVLNVPAADVVELPDGVDPVQAAALVNPGLSSWMSLRKRCDWGGNGGLKEGFEVCVVGATSTSGRIACQIARALGAAKVVGAARNEAALKSMGLDGYVVLKEKPEEIDYSPAASADVILDYIYGPAIKKLLDIIKPGKKVQYVQIGSLGSLEFNLSAFILRSKDLTLRGSGPGSWTIDEMQEETPHLLKAMKGMTLDEIMVLPLAEILKGWEETRKRVVFVP